MFVYIFGFLLFLGLSAELILYRNNLILKHYVKALEIIGAAPIEKFDEMIEEFKRHSQMWDVFNLTKWSFTRCFPELKNKEF